MKYLLLISLMFYLLIGKAQDTSTSYRFPLTITVFSESVGLPNFRNFFKEPNIGIRVGTEFYYSKSESKQLLQTVNVGYYHHKDLQNSFFISSEFGYRKFFNNAFVDGTIGAGYMLVNSALPRYEKNGNDYKRISNTFGRIMPTLGLGAGYQFEKFSVFSRYELFAEAPFGFKGVPALPHKALHVGTRFNLK